MVTSTTGSVERFGADFLMANDSHRLLDVVDGAGIAGQLVQRLPGDSGKSGYANQLIEYRPSSAGWAAEAARPARA